MFSQPVMRAERTNVALARQTAEGVLLLEGSGTEKRKEAGKKLLIISQKAFFPSIKKRIAHIYKLIKISSNK